MKENIERRKVLMKIGISADIKGYHYLLAAIDILQKQKIHTNISTVYEIIRKKYDEPNWQRVERAIRYSIENSYKKNDTLKKIYNEKPDNAAFLYDFTFKFDIFQEVCTNY